MRSLLLATALGGAQSLAVADSHKSKKPAIQALMESATTMLKNGATPAVVDFANETLHEVRLVVIPAILDESSSDQRFIDSLYSRFAEIETQLTNDNLQVHRLNEEEQTLSGDHKSCRDTEHGLCYDVEPRGKRKCEMDLYLKWTYWVEEEEELREIHDRIAGHFCPPDANGTLHQFRVTSQTEMELYMAQKVVVDAAEAAYDAEVPYCRESHDALNAETVTCNVKQTQLEEKACEHALKITEALTTYYADFAQAQASYNCAVEEIMQLEKDRKREWITLQVVNCLLDRVREQNGVPCDESTGTVTDEVGHCEERHGLEVCAAHQGDETCTDTNGRSCPELCLNYPQIPEDPQECPARDQVEGVCLPVVQPVPCSGEWHNQEYANLPGFPTAEFSATNPGCNAYPECVPCPAMDTPAPSIINSCPGYTVDGCEGNDAEAGEHPLTFTYHRSDGVGDVRCCSIDGDTCQSQHFAGGEVFNTPNGGTHEGCYFDVTYQEAMQVCHDAGMRICKTDEVQTCCNTGCWHNQHAIWVDSAGAHDGTNSLHDPQLD